MLAEGVSSSAVAEMAHVMKYNMGEIPLTYLGLPVRVSMRRESAWRPVVEKLKKGKWWWRYRVDHDALWCRVVRSIHGADGGMGGGRSREKSRKGSDRGRWVDGEWKWVWGWTREPRRRGEGELEELESTLHDIIIDSSFLSALVDEKNLDNGGDGKLCRDTIQLENAVSTISQEYMLEFTSEYGIPEDLHPELPGSKDTIMDFPEGKVNVDERIFLTVVDWRTSAPKAGMPLAGSYSAADVAALNTNQMDLFGLIRNPNPFKVKTGIRPRAAHEVPLLTAMASHVIVETAKTTEVVQEPVLEKEVAAIGPPVNKWRRQRGIDEVEANALPKVLRKDHATPHPA
ncbi:hypothetical protein Tco_0235708 [Tanacetum coccineum]